MTQVLLATNAVDDAKAKKQEAEERLKERMNG